MSGMTRDRPWAATHVKTPEPRQRRSTKKGERGRSPLQLHQSALCQRRRLAPGDDQVIKHSNVEQRE
jgi:hypothetical protein